MSCPFKKMKMSDDTDNVSEENKQIIDMAQDASSEDESDEEMIPEDEMAKKMEHSALSDDDKIDEPDLREFAILDEINDSEDEQGGGGELKDSESEAELSPESVEALLKSEAPNMCVQEKFETSNFSFENCEELPPDWIRKEYSAGIPFYVHVPTNIVSTTRPYMLGAGSIKKHKLCMNAIPCLDYVRRIGGNDTTEGSLLKTAQESTPKGAEEKTAMSETSDETSPKIAEENIETSVDEQETPFKEDEEKTERIVDSGTEDLKDSELLKSIVTTGNEAETVVQYDNLSTAVLGDKTSTSLSESTTPNYGQDGISTTPDEGNKPADEEQESITKPLSSADTKCHADSVQHHASNFMTHEEAVRYFKKLYKYKTIKLRKFSSWKMKRAFVHKQKCQNKITKNIPSAPEGTLVILVPMLNTRTNKLELQDWSLNPKGKSYVCILHEYLQRAVKTHPVYEFKELENAKTPYLATIKLNNMQYGSGIGSSKRIAKLEAAKATLEILLPQLKVLWKKNDTNAFTGLINDEDKYTLFDTVKITDPKVTQYCRALGESPPYSMLLTCIEKNFDEDSQEIKQTSKPIGRDKFLFTMELESSSASVKCISKKEGQQLASQIILQQLHPQVHYLGSLLRMYGNAILKGVKEKKSHGEEKAPKKKEDDSPNLKVLKDLRDAMNVIYADRKFLLDEGGFVAPPDIDECVAVMYKEMKDGQKNTSTAVEVVTTDPNALQDTPEPNSKEESASQTVVEVGLSVQDTPESDSKEES